MKILRERAGEIIVTMTFGAFGFFCWNLDHSLWVKNCLLAIFLGGVASQIAIWSISLFLVGDESDHGNSRLLFPNWKSGLIVGVLERLFFVVIVGLGGVAAAVAGSLIWISLKAQTFYNIIGAEGLMSRKEAFISIVVSLISLMFAFIFGSIINDG